MADRLFGIETEYGLAATTAGGEPVEGGQVAANLLDAARRVLPCARGLNQGGLFLGNGSRFYIDCGVHPEFCTPEVTCPEDAVAHVAAGERILARLVAEVERASKFRVMLLRGNVDYQTGVTYGRHESYLHATSTESLEEQLTPHIVSRVIFGAGGFNPKSQGIEFSLSPRSAHFHAAISNNSTSGRGIIHRKFESLAGSNYQRFHVICPGDTLLSESGIYLNIATTALLVALIEAAGRPGNAIGLADPVAALRTFSADPTCRSEAALTRGGTASALAIQRHYLRRVEHALPKGRLPAWAPEVCIRWRAVLDRLEAGAEAAAGTLDWATKYGIYGDHARERGFGWDDLAFWTAVTKSLREAMNRADVESLSCEEAVAPDSPIRDNVVALTPDVMRRGATWDHLRRFIDLRQEFHALDTRWGQLGPPGIWEGLEAAGALSHRIVRSDLIDGAVTTPPGEGRARLRGEMIQEASATGSAIHASWDRLIDQRRRLFLDLSDPFVDHAEWRPVPPAPRRGNPSWMALLQGEPRFAQDRPGLFQELDILHGMIESSQPDTAVEPLMRRVLAIVESSFSPDHSMVAACLRALLLDLSDGEEAQRLSSRARAIEKLNACRRAEGPQHPEVALACNELAICLRSQGLASQAEQVFREAVAIEERALPDDHPKRPHRLNNLASVLLMQDKREEASQILDRAWRLQSGRCDLTGARILCLRLALEWLEGRSGSSFLGQLKSLSTESALRADGNITTTWDVSAVWESLRPRLPEARLLLLQRFSTALDGGTLRGQFEDFEEWTAASPVPLDAPWPESVTAPRG